MAENEAMLEKEQVKQIAERIASKTRRRAYALKLNRERKPGLYESKFGGVPYWDLKLEYPTDKKGNPMILLAQMNLEGLEPLDNGDGIELPHSGMLQFFLAADDIFGIDFDNPDVQDTFRVIYHKAIDKSVTEEQVRALGVKSCTDEEVEYCSPVCISAAVDISVEAVSLSECDYRYEQLWDETYREIIGQDHKRKGSLYNIVNDDDYEQFILGDLGEYASHNMLGYPYFTQSDPRADDEKRHRYDTLLFQMDSDSADTNEDYVLWGDCGVGNFFINGEDLKNLDFSRVLYNWDCC